MVYSPCLVGFYQMMDAISCKIALHRRKRVRILGGVDFSQVFASYEGILISTTELGILFKVRMVQLVNALESMILTEFRIAIDLMGSQLWNVHHSIDATLGSLQMSIFLNYKIRSCCLMYCRVGSSMIVFYPTILPCHRFSTIYFLRFYHCKFSGNVTEYPCCSSTGYQFQHLLVFIYHVSYGG